MISNIRMRGNHQGVADIEQRENFYELFQLNAITAFYAKQLSEKMQNAIQASKNRKSIVLMQNVFKTISSIKTLMPAITIIEK